MLRDSRVPLSSGAAPNVNRVSQTMYSKRMSWPGPLMGLMFLICWLAQPGWGYSGGLGSLQAPYLIASADDLIELAQNPKDYGKHFLLTEDIDLSRHSFDQAVIAPSSTDAWTEFHNGDVFYGTINGNGYVIRNLSISGSSNLGLIGIMGPYAQVYGLGMVNASIVGTGENAGMLAAYSEGRITNSYCTGSVKGNTQVGGLVGENRGYIENSYSGGTISGVSHVGGLAGSSSSRREILNCYSSCTVTADSADSPDTIGGLTGTRGQASNSFWDVQTSGVSESGAGTGLDTEQMHMISTFLDAGWDFQGEAANGCRETWFMPEAGGYPVLGIFHDLASALPTDCAVTSRVCMLPGDANEVLWDSTASLAPNWDSVAVTRITKNPAEYAENAPGERDVVITVAGRVEVLDANNLIALDARNSVPCQAIDAQGNGIMLRHSAAPFEPRHCWEVLNTSPRPFTLQLQLDPSQAVPAALSKVDFYVYGLYAQPLTTIEIPFEPMDDWMELWPGFRIIIETAQLEDGQCKFTIKEEVTGLSNSDNLLGRSYDLCDPDESSWYRPEDALTAIDLFYSRDMIDALGMPTSHRGGNASSSSDSSGGRTLRTESGRWEECSGIEFIRYTVAVRPYRLVIPLTLVDVQVSGL
jgi:hypothetical protein